VNDARRLAEALPQTAKSSSAPESIALLLQGGGALGSYQAGVYQALLECGIEPTWIAGISIGAINSAIIAGNAVGDRLAKLRAFWEMVSDAGDNGWNDHFAGLWQGDKARGWINQIAANRTMMGGVPGFFTPRMPPPYLLPAGVAGVTSYYDVTSLRSTIERLIDFDRINAKAMRFSVGAVNVRTGNFAYFDNKTDTIRPEHIMASCALPPAFDAIEVDGEFYWDGGMVSTWGPSQGVVRRGPLNRHTGSAGRPVERPRLPASRSCRGCCADEGSPVL
jgi:NTE family protein